MKSQSIDLEEADIIISIVENLFISDNSSIFGFSKLKGYTRIDVVNAFKVNIAYLIRDEFINPKIKWNVGEFIKSCDGIMNQLEFRFAPDDELFALTLISDKSKRQREEVKLGFKFGLSSLINSSIPEQVKIWKTIETPSSFAKYCYTLDPFNDNFFYHVYNRIGIDIPDEILIQINVPKFRQRSDPPPPNPSLLQTIWKNVKGSIIIENKPIISFLNVIGCIIFIIGVAILIVTTILGW